MNIETLSAALATSLHVDPRLVQRRARYLREAGLFPRGIGPAAPSLAVEDVATLLLSVLAAGEPKDAVAAVKRCQQLRPYTVIGRHDLRGRVVEQPMPSANAPLWRLPLVEALARALRDTVLHDGAVILGLSVSRSGAWAQLALGADDVPTLAGVFIRYADEEEIELARACDETALRDEGAMHVVASATATLFEDLVAVLDPVDMAKEAA
ncbi:MAG: hypothetical protein AB7P12_17070 [Alphaproteobacteria bacterium]